MKALFYFTKQLFAFARFRLIVNLVAMIGISLLEGVGILLLIPMLSLTGVVDVSTSQIPLVNHLSFLNSFSSQIGLIVVLSTFITIAVGQAAFNRSVSRKSTLIHVEYVNYLRLRTYRQILQSNWEFFISKRKSDLINSLTSELGRVSAGTHTFLQLITSSIFTIVQIALAFWISPLITIFVMGAGLILAIFSKRFIGKSRKIGDETTKLAKEYLSGISDVFNGIKDIKSNSLESSRYEWLEGWCVSITNEQREKVYNRTNSQFLYKTSSAILIAVFLYFSITFFSGHPEQLLLIIIIFSRLWPRFTGIQSSIEQIASTIPAFNSLIDLQKDCLSADEKVLESHSCSTNSLQLNDKLECQGIYFKYGKNGAQTYALKNINMSVPFNRMTAIVGPSGAGKSTLIDILMGLTVPSKGKMLINDIPIKEKDLLSLRKEISYVPQDPFLFNATIRENLLMVDQHATEEQIWEALRFSAASEFVKKLPQGLDTEIGDRGVRLSGGERQRLVLARAILKKPAILVLDEATSALDSENEAKIQEAIEGLKGRMTIIVIAHRLSTIRNADQVIVLDGGKIVQDGSFRQLARDKKSLFNHLLAKQTETVLLGRQ